MKVVYLCLFLALVAAEERKYANEWENFKSVYKRNYSTQKEEWRRYQIYASNQKAIRQHNIRATFGQETYTMAENNFADMTKEEFTTMWKGLKGEPRRNGTLFSTQSSSFTALPTSVDWRTKNAVTPVEDQSYCGSCWAFSTTGAIEGQLSIKRGSLVPLSEQQLVDCSTSYGNQGCNGGLMDQAFTYIKQSGIMTEADYPYTGQDGSCKADLSKTVTKVAGYVDVTQGSESALQAAVANVGPISVAMDASNLSFQFYSSGIYTARACSSLYLDHAVLVVGYGTENGVPFWIVKNSWGTKWGEKGFFRIARNRRNHCGIATAASYPVL